MIAVALALVALLGAPASVSTPKGQIPLRFHHVHLKVADPAAAMSAFAQRVGGTRTIVKGIGVGVKTAGYYVVFDRAGGEDEAARPPATADITERYRKAAASLIVRGAAVTPADLPPALRDVTDVVALGHVAFTSTDFDRAVETFVAAGTKPIHRTDDAAQFVLDGSIVEIARDADRPDAFWCPMHLDVRSPDAGKCPACGMELVPIPPLRLGEYRLDVDVRPRELTLRVADPDGRPVTEFVTVHERPFHLFVISRDLSYFAHVHPEAVEKPAGTFRLPLDAKQPLPPGAYVAIADVLPYRATAQMLHRAFVTPRYRGAVFAPPPVLTPGPAEVAVDGVRIRIDADPAARKEGTIRFTLADAASGAPIADLEPFLGAPAHLLIVKPDLTDAIHAHPEERQTPGPSVSFAPLMPAPGVYKLWVQFQRKGRVTTVPFVVEVRSFAGTGVSQEEESSGDTLL